MVKNYIKLALRSLVKNKLVAFINIFGLSTAIGFSIAIYNYIDFEFNVDQSHTNKDKIYLVQNVVERDGQEQLWGDSPAPIGAMLKQDFPQVEAVVRMDGKSAVMKYENQVFNEFPRFVDPEFFEVFDFPLRLGSKDALNDPSKVVISHDIAVKYFGDRDPIGEQITLIFSDEKEESFIIGAVGEDYPFIYSFTYNVLINWEKKRVLFPDEKEDDWSEFITATFIQLDNAENVTVVESGMKKYVALQNAVEDDFPAQSYPLQVLSTLSRNSWQIRGDISAGDEPTGRIVLSIMAGFLLALACFNYMNIAIVSASKRLKEIGVRKSIGGSKGQLVRQFLIENVVLTLFSLFIGGLIAMFIILPWFNIQFGIELQENVFANPRMWLFFLGMLIFVGVASGAYPAFYISSFKPSTIFRGSLKLAGKSRFTKVFLTFQFILSIIAITGGVVFINNVKYQRAQDWGYNQENIYSVQVSNSETYRALKNRALQNPDVISATGSGNLIGRTNSLAIIDKNGEKSEVRKLDIGPDYFEALDLRLAEGRSFDETLKTDEQSVIVNELFVDRMGWDQIIDNVFVYDSIEYSIIGVVEDFHYQSFWNKVEPAFLRMVPEEDFNWLSVKVQAGKGFVVEEYLKESWSDLEPDLPYNGYFQDTLFDDYFNNIVGHSRLIGFAAGLAIILSSMGLFGLVSLNVASKMKEFSIRKVLGAGAISMAKKVNQQYIWLLVIATVLGAPLSFWVMSNFLESIYEYHIAMSVNFVVLGVILIFLIAGLTVSSLVLKVLKTNPVNALRSE